MRYQLWRPCEREPETISWRRRDPNAHGTSEGFNLDQQPQLKPAPCLHMLSDKLDASSPYCTHKVPFSGDPLQCRPILAFPWCSTAFNAAPTSCHLQLPEVHVCRDTNGQLQTCKCESMIRHGQHMGESVCVCLPPCVPPHAYRCERVCLRRGPRAVCMICCVAYRDKACVNQGSCGL